MLLLGLQMLVPSLTVQVVPNHLLKRMVGPRLTTKNVISLHLVVKKLKLIGLLHLLPVEILQVLLFRMLPHSKKNIIPFGVKPSQVVTLELQGHEV